MQTLGSNVRPIINDIGIQKEQVQQNVLVLPVVAEPLHFYQPAAVPLNLPFSPKCFIHCLS